LRRPRIKRTTEEIETPDGDVYLLRPSADNDIRIEKPDADERRLLTSLNGERTLEELREDFGAKAVDDAVAQLGAMEVVEDADDDELIPAPELERFDRQLRYFSDIGGETTPSQCQERLREAKVAVLGVGGLGGWSAWALACTGVGEMWLIDGDRVEVTNLNRQILYTEADIGELKVERAAARLSAFNSAMKVTTEARRLESEADIAEFIAGSDVVIDAADWPAHDIERWCNAACFKADIPYITMSHFPPIARVGPLYIPGKTGCFVCQEISYRRDYPLFDVAVEQRRAKPSPAATLGPACGLIGGQVATGLARPATQGVAHIYDLRTMEPKLEPVVPEPECPVCGGMDHEKAPTTPEEDSADG
jgi:bacteriocin biosynthesis cyclodehydratase domain-containing protein